MPKKTSKSGFYYFMLDYKENQEKMGLQFPNGLRDVQVDPKCSEAWKTLTAEEKARYNRRSKNANKNRGKLAGSGESIELLEQQKQEQIEYETNMREIIDQSIKQAYKNKNLDTTSFYFIHVNHFYTKVNLDENWTDYIPAEYAVVEFSLKDGIKRTHHQIIRTEIQTGYAREYIEHSDNTHKLSNDLSAGEEDYATMYNNLVKFLKFNASSDILPPLYTVKKMMTVVPCLLERMTAAVNEDIKIFDLYSLEYLFGTLMSLANDNFPETGSRAILAAAYLDKDEFFWTPNIECFFHIDLEGTGPYCSQSIVQRWAFTIADYCCLKFSINLKPGFHCPLSDLTDAITSLQIQTNNTLSLRNEVSAVHGSMAKDHTKGDNCRNNHNSTLKIIDYGKNPQSNADNMKEIPMTHPTCLPTKKKHSLKTMATVFASSDEIPVMNDENFPVIGGRGKL